MSIKIMSRVWENSRAEGGELLVLLALADRANDDGLCWPGIPSLAQKARLKERQVQNCLKSLVERGELLIHHTKGGARNTNVFLIIVGLSPATVQRITPLLEDGEAKRVQWAGITVQSDAETVQPGAPDSSLNTSINPQPELVSGAIVQVLTEACEFLDGGAAVLADRLAGKIEPDQLRRLYIGEDSFWMTCAAGPMRRKPLREDVERTWYEFEKRDDRENRRQARQ